MNASTEAPTVAAQNLAAGKGADNVFSGLSFELPPASFTALTGPNGCGKTTLFETLLGLVKPGRGSIDLLGLSARKARAHVAYVPQASQLMHDGQFIGREFVAAAYRGRCWGMPLGWKAAGEAVNDALGQVDAQDLARRKLSALSGGQRQRLLIAQALVNQPRLMFLDEPLAQLDPAAQDRIVALTARLRDRLGIAVLFSTHDVNPVVDVADRVLYLAAGQGRIGAIDEIISDDVLSMLYGVPMHVVREHGRLFVMRDQVERTSAARIASLREQRRRA